MTSAPPTVLVVDDNDDARTSLGWILQGHGFRTLEAGTGREALRLAKTHPDLVVLDVVLPDRSGVEVCRLLKADPDTAPTPILMLSGQAVTDGDRVVGLDGGADAYLTKPADPAVLLAHANALLRVRRAEDRLRASEGRFRAVVESSDAAIVTTDPDWVVQTWNPAAERLFGYAAAEMVGRSILDLVPAAERDDTRRLIERVRSGGWVPPYEADRVRKDGGTIRVSVNPWPVRDAAGAFVSLAAIYTDLTERHQLEERVRQAQKMDALGQLAGGVAHDFNNLLTVINGYAELVADGLAAGDPARALLSELRQAGERAAGLTRQLLAFSRKAVVAPRSFDLNAVVRDVGRMLRRLIGEDIDLATWLHPDLGPVKADPGQVEQVVMNLAVNARDAMPTGGKLTFETREVELDAGYARVRPGVTPGRYALLAVSDTGTGIAADVLPHMFEPFFTTKGVGKGTGLGLATVHGVVRQAGGHVAVHTEVGVGTTFKVYLPLAETPDRAAAPSAPAAPPPGTETLLLVEDEPAVRALAQITLERAGYAVLGAGCGEEAERVARGHPARIHALVTDVVMPGMGGRELAGRLQAARPGLRVLYLSGYTDDAVVRHGVLEDQVHFLQKPFTPAALARKVREVLDAPG